MRVKSYRLPGGTADVIGAARPKIENIQYTIHYETIPLEMQTLRKLLLSWRFSYLYIRFLNLDCLLVFVFVFQHTFDFQRWKLCKKMALVIRCNPVPVLKKNFFFFIFLKIVRTNVFITLRTRLHNNRYHFPIFFKIKIKIKLNTKIQQLSFRWWTFQQNLIALREKITFSRKILMSLRASMCIFLYIW